MSGLPASPRYSSARENLVWRNDLSATELIAIAALKASRVWRGRLNYAHKHDIHTHYNDIESTRCAGKTWMWSSNYNTRYYLETLAQITSYNECWNNCRP